MIYLAAPYTHNDPRVVEERMRIFCTVDAKLCTDGLITVSPLSKHFIDNYVTIETTWNFWKSYSEQLLAKCDSIYVIVIDGWKESPGVQGEIRLAKEMNKEIVYLDEHGERIWI